MSVSINSSGGIGIPERPEKGSTLIVGIGASAGGIQALQQFFRNVPDKSNMAYVVILHLSPEYDSKLAEVLRHTTSMPVLQVSEKTKVKTNHIYVIPPDKHLHMEDGVVLVSPNVQEEDRRAPVDIFFRTMAQSHGARAVCVILSGSGANGSMGLKSVKEMGGAVFVQNPHEAEFNEMPRNAIATDMVDQVLPVADIPGRIIQYKQSVGTIQIPVEADKRGEEQQHALKEIFGQLRLRTGHDFSNYKRPTLHRRLERRINVRNLPDLPSYNKYLQENPEEINALLKDLLISVTNFFRDRTSFDVLKNEVLPLIFKDKKPEDEVRIWVAGCATGEEAYSIAMMCAERTIGMIDAPKVQIFATDIDEAAIAVARDGLYTLNDAADVPPELLRKYFTNERHEFRIRREIREMILFANHNFLKDPPFSHLDLVSCRNVLIYLNQAAQERVMETFHFALNKSGFLFVGSSESVNGASDLYTVFNREHHIMQSQQVISHRYPIPDLVQSFSTTRQQNLTQISTPERTTPEQLTFADLHLRLIEELSPPSLVINEEYEIVHLSEKAGKFLQITGGEPSQNLLKLIQPELRLELRSALYRAIQQHAPVEIRSMKLNIDDKTETIDIRIKPLFREKDIAHGLILVVFDINPGDSGGKDMVIISNEPVAIHLEEELNRLKGQLRTSIEQHDFQTEELKASNEELQAMNEELRSSTEELETGKEELQSINEELRTVNQELKIKIEETTIAGNNLQNLINSADIGTIFLDRSLRVALFTPSARSLFNLIPNDIGRPLSDITNKLNDANIIRDAETVLEKMRTVKREIHTNDGRILVMRVLPYRTDEDRINGVVITFVDITDRARAEEALRISEERYRAALQSANMAAWDWDIGSDKVIWNDQYYVMLGLQPEEDGRPIGDFFHWIHDDNVENVKKEIDAAVSGGDVFQAEFQMRMPSDNARIRWMRAYGRIVNRKQGVATRMVGVMYDITQNKRVEQRREEFLGVASHELKTPVTSIKIYGEVLEEQFVGKKDEKSAGLMRKLNAQVDHLTELIEDLLDTTKIAEGRLSLNEQPVDLNKLIREIAEEQQLTTQKHTLEIQLADIPVIDVDRKRITQVVTNLLSNAIKYSPGGGVINIKSESLDSSVKVSFTDEGIGISKESQEKIFERFFRINNPNINTYPGMGLGLYITAGIVHRHGGMISVESDEGRGSVFSFTLPLHRS